MRILVCGGTGVIGRSLVPLLVARGHEVTVLARSAEAEQLAASLGARAVAGDILDPACLRAAAPGHDAIIHAATQMPRAFPGRPADFVLNDRIRREGTAHLLAAAEASGIGSVVFQSIIWVHGDQRGAWIDEDASLKPGRIGQSAVDLESQARAFAARTGAVTTVLRLGGLYGATAWHTREILERLRKRMAPIIGDGDNYQSFLHADDAAAALAAALEGPGGTYFVTDDEPVRLADYLRWLAKTSGAPEPLRVPHFVARLALGAEMEAAYTASLRCRNDRIKQRLGWAPKYPTFRDGYGEVLPRLKGTGTPGHRGTEKAAEG